MKQADVYLDLKGREISQVEFTAAERSLIADMKAAEKELENGRLSVTCGWRE